jgi:hypothetical protein
MFLAAQKKEDIKPQVSNTAMVENRTMERCQKILEISLKMQIGVMTKVCFRVMMMSCKYQCV